MGQIGKIIDGKFVPFADLGGGKTILTPNKAVVSGADGTVQASEVTAEEVGFLAGLTGNVQEQIDSTNKILNITQENFFTDIYAEVGFWHVRKRGKTIAIYGRMTADSSGKSSVNVGSVNNLYVPLCDTFAFYAYSVQAPYLPVGTLWMFANGDLTFYPSDVNNSVSFYVSEEYTI